MLLQSASDNANASSARIDKAELATARRRPCENMLRVVGVLLNESDKSYSMAPPEKLFAVVFAELESTPLLMRRAPSTNVACGRSQGALMWMSARACWNLGVER